MARQILNLGTPVRGEGLPGAESRHESFRKTDENFAEVYAGVVASSSKSANHTLALADAGAVVEFTATATLTVPADATVAFPVGTTIELCQMGAGTVTIAAAGGVTLRTPSSLTTRAQYATVALRKRAADDWVVAGDLT